MRISIVTGFFLPVPPIRGGSTEKIWFRLAREFSAAGHQVTFLSRQWPGFADREVVDGITHIRVAGASHSRSLAVNLWHDLWWGVRVARALPPADVVICNTVTLPVWLRRVRPAAGRVIAVLARMPKGHGRAYGNVDLLLSLSDAVSARLRAENPRLASRIRPFPYPIDWTRHARAAAKAIAPAPLTIGYVGRIHPEKGIALLLAAAARLAARPDLPHWRIELVGPWTVPEGGGGEPFRAGLSAKFAPILGDRLTFAGPEFDLERLASRYGRMDVFCYPSTAESGETFGVAIAEAMAAGCAPVVSQLACFGDLVRDGDTGVTFYQAGADAEVQLADALARLLSGAALRRTIAARAQEHVRRFDYPIVARALLDQLETLAPSPVNETAGRRPQ
jgi:glycosyltransferase involved in cell wall biosynthesis